MPQFNSDLFDDNPQAFIDSMPICDILAFRDTCFTSEFVSSYPAVFLDHKWIKVDNLREWLCSRDGISVDQTDLDVVARPIIKSERSECPSYTFVKPEPKDEPLYPEPRSTPSEVIEILDTDEEEELKRRKLKLKKQKWSDSAERSLNLDSIPLPFNPADFTSVADTIWEDSNIVSHVLEKPFHITKEVRVERVEYLNELPSLWPIPRRPTAFILDLRDEKYNLKDKAGMMYRVDTLVKNKDQDSWTSSTGTGDSRSMVVFQPGFPPISCRRSRSDCRGCFACAQVDSKLLRVERYELDPGPRAKIFAAQQETRASEETGSKEQKAATFLSVVRSSECKAKDSTGKVCNGRPRMQPKPDGPSNGHVYFIACSGWRKNFKHGHRTLKIPDYVDEAILAALMTNQTLSEDCDTPPCSRVVSPHIGLKLKQCPHMHIVDGKTGSRSPILHHPCLAKRRMYIPEDPEMRFLLLIHPGPTPHNHPIPPMSKASLEAKVIYENCIDAAGSSGLTVQKVDNAPSTKLLLQGMSPGEYNTALVNQRIKRDLLHTVKIKKNPAGLGIPGVFDLFRQEFTKAKEDRYIHNIITTETGKLLIITGVPYLLSLIHEVQSFECDTTFKRVKDVGINEWEMVIYYPPVQRAITIARIYLDSAETAHYECLFDELQKHIKSITGKPLSFKKFSTDGNLLCMNADMEAAQVLGAARSIKKSIDFEHSGLPNDISPEDLAAYFVRLCLTHTKRGILDFKSLVSVPDFRRLMDFPYLNSIEELESFSKFVKQLKIKKIQDWWDHKYTSKWIIPCILKSQSKIDPQHIHNLPATTNIGEGQHHWTNHQSGIKLPIVEAILTAREIDERVGREIEGTLKSGIKTNTQTDLVHRMARQAQRQSASARKAHDATKAQDLAAELQSKLDEEKENQRNAAARQKELQAQLKALKAGSSGGKRQTSKKSAPASPERFLEGSSSGRVKMTAVSGSSSGRMKLQSSPYHGEFSFPYSSLDLILMNGTVNTDLNANSDLNMDVDPNADADIIFSQFHHHGALDFSEFLNLDPPFYDANTSSEYNDEAPYIYPDTLLPMPPPPSSPPVSSSPLLSQASSPDFTKPSPPLQPLSMGFTDVAVNVIDTKGKKRARDEIDERDILPAGSRRTINKPTREPILVSLRRI